MDTRQIREILKGTFHDPKDRKYWEEALKEAERKERNSRELEKMSTDRDQRIRGYQTLGVCAGAALAILFV